MNADMRAVIFLLAVAGAASARADDARAVSAMAAARDRPSYALSDAQLGLLDSWLKEHRWRRNVATPPAPAFNVTLKQADGTTRTLAFFDQAGWAGAVILDGRVASSSAEDIASFRAKLGGLE